MVATGNQLGIAVVGKDQITQVMKRVEQSVSSVGRKLDEVGNHTRRLDSAFGSLGNRLKTGIQWHILNNGLNMLDRAFRRITEAIPDLIRRGEQWAAVVDDIGDVTGMTAKQASELAAVQAIVGGNTDALTKGLVQMSKAAQTNETAFKKWGIATRDQNGHLLGAYDIFQNTRTRLAQLGNSTKATAAGAQLMGRGFKDLADILTLTNPQMAALVVQARQAGLILTAAGVRAAEQWARTKRMLGLSITGIGAQILQGVAPALIGLTNAVTKTLNQNMDAIVKGVSWMVVTIAQTIASLLGYDLDIKLPKGGGGGGAGGSQTGQQAPTAAMKKAESAYKGMASAAREYREALRALEAAKGDSPFAGNMSRADFIQAQQARQAAIKAARERVSDAQKALRDHRDTMHQIERETGITAQRIGQNLGKDGPIIKGLQGTIDEARKTGKDIARSIRDAIFGSEKPLLGSDIPIPGLPPIKGVTSITQRQGGLVGALQGLQKFLSEMSGHLANLNNLLGGNGPLVLGILALVRLLPGGGTVLGGAVAGAARVIGGFGRSIFRFPAAGAGATSPGAATTAAVGALGVAQVINAMMRGSGPIRPDEYGGMWGMYGMTPSDVKRVTDQMDRNPNASSPWDRFVAWANRGFSNGPTTAGPNGVYQRTGGLSFRDYFNRGQGYTYPLGGPMGGMGGSGTDRDVTDEERRQISIAAWRAIRSRSPFGFDGSRGAGKPKLTPDSNDPIPFWPSQDTYPPGLGIDTRGATDAQFRHLADVMGWASIDRSLGESGPLASGLSDIESAISGLSAALTGGGTGGGDGAPPPSGGNGNSLAGIRVRLKAVETVNKVQGRAIVEARSLAAAANTVNVIQAQNMQEHLRRINAQGGRIDKLWEEAIDHGWFSFGGPKVGLRGGRGGATTVRLVLDAKETRRLFHRGVATTTLRPDN